MVKRPIDAFVKYFLDVKPYHTKILEIVEQYLFTEDVNVNIKENIFFTEMWGNKPLCAGIGFGYDFDDECGYSTLSCCDLFDCYGGYGLVFDNSDLLVSAPVIAIASRTSDGIEYGFTVAGDYRFDTTLQIESIVGDNTIKIRGNVVSVLSPHHLFVISPTNVYGIAEVVSNGFYISGNVETQFATMHEFIVQGSPINDNTYGVTSAKYDIDSNRTFIEIVPPIVPLDINALGKILIKSTTKNNGVYQRTDAFFDGTFTNITLHPDSLIKLPDETKHGSVVLRTGLLPNRMLHFIGDLGDFDTKVSDIVYDPINNTTTVYISSTEDLGVEDLGSEYDITIELRGYFSGAGFDGYNECSIPKPFHLYSTISEYLWIGVVSEAGCPDSPLLRIMEDGSDRITEDGSCRELEPEATP